MRLKPIVFFVATGVLAGYFVYREATRTDHPGLVRVGDQAPDFSIKDEQGRKIRLSDLRGKVVFLNFWATWCGPCIEEAPEIDILHHTFKDRRFQMLTVSSDTTWNAVKNFQENGQYDFPVYLDPGQQVSRLIYKITGWPETYLIDANGIIVKHTFAAHWAAPDAIAKVQELIRQAEEHP